LPTHRFERAEQYACRVINQGEKTSAKGGVGRRRGDEKGKVERAVLCGKKCGDRLGVIQQIHAADIYARSIGACREGF
jgi:hypothetical protein